MNSRNVLRAMIGLVTVTLLVVGCGPQEIAPAAIDVAEAPEATPTPVPPTATPTPTQAVTLSEEPDEATFEKYLSNISLGKLPADARLDEPDLPTPATTFAVGDQLCVTMDIIGPADELSTEIYGLQEQNYITTVTNFQSVMKNVRFDKGVVVGGNHIQCGTYPFVEGKYELRVRVGDVLVAMIPFEVK